MRSRSVLAVTALTRRVVWGVVAVLAVAAGAALAGPATASADLSSARIVAALNKQRLANGIPPVRNDRQMAAGCAAYNRYVVRNGMSVADEHFEIPGKPGYTAAGDHAARTSVLASTPGTVTAAPGRPARPVFPFGWSEGDPWNYAAFHLFQMMNPALAVTGANELTAKLRTGEWVRLECLTTQGGPWRTRPAKMHLYSYPRSRSTLPARELNQEGARVLGTAPGAYGPPLIFTYFFGAGVTSLRIHSVRARLAGKSIALRLGYAGGASGPSRTAAARTAEANPSSGWYAPEPAVVFEPYDPNAIDHLTPKQREALKVSAPFGSLNEFLIRGIANP